MILIADSGSTKTMWMEVGTGNKVVTEGLNPHFTSDDRFLAACNHVRQNFSIFNFQFSIYFYGAGCGSELQRERVAALLGKAFGTREIHVETDMLGACRAVCGRESGLVGILGTGSNACYYDGERVAFQAVSTGYILGDHGSANHVGRRMLQDYLSGTMPRHLKDMFHEVYPMTKDEFLDAVYRQPNANRYLASLARFAVEHREEEYCDAAIQNSLEEWFKYQLEGVQRQSSCVRMSFVGGFAARISPLLEKLCQTKGIQMVRVEGDPIDGLREFHMQHELP